MSFGEDRNPYNLNIQAEGPADPDEETVDFELMSFDELWEWRPWREPQYELNYLKHCQENERPLAFLVRILDAQVRRQEEVCRRLEDQLPPGGDPGEEPVLTSEEERIAARLQREGHHFDYLQERLYLRQEQHQRRDEALQRSMETLAPPTNWY